MTFNIVRFEKDKTQEWDSFVRKSKNGLFMHLRSFCDYHSDRFTDHSLMFYLNKTLFALLPANVNESTLFSHGGLTYGGLILSTKSYGSDVVNAVGELKSYLKSNCISEIIYKAIPSFYHKYPCQEDLYALVYHGAQLVRRDLSSAIDFKNQIKLSDSRKSTARKASKVGASFERLQEVPIFHNLLTNALKKHAVKPVHSCDEIIQLMNAHPDNIFLYGTVLNGDLLAAAMIFDFGNVVHTQYLATCEEGKKIGALDFLLVELIKFYSNTKAGMTFGVSTESNGTILNNGLLSQKEGFGGRGIVHDFYRMQVS